jgi:drug/metabolite transporter (DMT)-like permease
LTVSTAAKVSTHAYVNPVVAVLLGWLLAGEPIVMRAIAAITHCLAEGRNGMLLLIPPEVSGGRDES